VIAPTLSSGVAFVALSVPFAALLVLAVILLTLPKVDERRIHQVVAGGLLTGLVATVTVAVALLLGSGHVELDVGSVLAIRGFHIDLAFMLDAKAVVMLTLDYLLCGVVGLFSARYLHRQPGYARFYLLLMLFSFGVALVSSARGLDLLFAGWELVGLASALLIAFFHERGAPVRHGLRAYAVYRFTDVGLLMAVVLLHHLAGDTDLHALAADPPVGGTAILIGGLLVFGAMGKGASVPFTGWLPRAMEGPTPSSAIFYGALSIHASPFLLLRVQPLLDAHLGLRAAVVGVGLVTAMHASMVGRTQTDVKSGLGYASVAQVGLIWVWAGLGLETIALIHIVGHATLRTWQLLRAPSLLHDRRHLDAQLGRLRLPTGRHIELLMPRALRVRLYALALERWYLDELLKGLLATLTFPFRALDRLDRAWAGVLDGAASPANVAEAAPEASSK
jgi:NADH-quinone oxidoreductase subunit L